MVCVGIDVAKDKHDCFILSSEGEVLADVFTIANNRDGFEALLQRVQSNVSVGSSSAHSESTDSKSPIGSAFMGSSYAGSSVAGSSANTAPGISDIIIQSASRKQKTLFFIAAFSSFPKTDQARTVCFILSALYPDFNKQNRRSVRFLMITHIQFDLRHHALITYNIFRTFEK